MIATDLATWGVGDLDVPEATRLATRTHLLDGFGTAVAAARLGAADPAVAVALDLGGPGEAGVIGRSVRIGAPGAALANGTLVHALDFDDTHAGGLVHATSVVLPAAFAIGQQCGSSGREVADAAVVGYEVACRVAAAAPHAFHARGLHATMVAGVFSSALIAARLMHLDAATATSALGIAGSQAGGLLAFLGTGASTKQLHPGFASQAGILAARLAAAGATGPQTVFDGPHGVYDALAGGSGEPASILHELGSTWETERIGIKPHPVCQLSHATLDAVLAALGGGRLDIAQITAVDARVHPDSASVVCDVEHDLTRPASAYAAKFSLPWSVAALLVDGCLRLETFAEDALRRTDVEEVARKVTWTVTPHVGVAADAVGEVTITLADGSVVHGHVQRSAGGPDNPLTRDQLVAKFTANAGPQAADLVDLVDNLEHLDSVGPVLAATVVHPDRAQTLARTAR